MKKLDPYIIIEWGFATLLWIIVLLLVHFVVIGLIRECKSDDQLFLDGGIGVLNSAKSSLSETKFASLGIQDDLIGPMKDRFSIGGWLDHYGNGRSSSANVSFQLGFEVNTESSSASIFTGPSVITTPDTYLGGRFQFQESVNYGVHDFQSNYIGVFYKHFSSAGIETPNIGRDGLGVELRIPW